MIEVTCDVYGVDSAVPVARLKDARRLHAEADAQDVHWRWMVSAYGNGQEAEQMTAPPCTCGHALEDHEAIDAGCAYCTCLVYEEASDA